LAKISNSMMYGDRMPESWRRSVLIPLYKGKGDAKECSNYRSLKILVHAMKILERFFERRIQGATTISNIQMRFMSGKSTVDAIFAVRRLVERYRTVRKDLFVAFIDLKKAFDCVRNLYGNVSNLVGIEKEKSDEAGSESCDGNVPAS